MNVEWKDALPEVRIVKHKGVWLCTTSDNVVLPVTDWLDTDGEQCDPEHAVVCVAGEDGYGWLTIELTGELESIH